MALGKKTTVRKGFTLIELLVVIAIIAILAAILFPVFAKARDKARTTACLNNIKEIALAIQMYLGDWDGFYPWVMYDYNNPGQDPDLESGMLPYVENNYALFHCPNDNTARSAGRHANTYGFCQPDGGIGLYGDSRSGSYWFESRNIDDLHSPANFIMITEIQDEYLSSSMSTVEVCYYWGWGVCTLGFTDSTWPTNPNIVTPHTSRHAANTVGNMAFADGHAKGVSSDLPCTAGWVSPYCQELGGMYTMYADGPFDDYGTH